MCTSCDAPVDPLSLPTVPKPARQTETVARPAQPTRVILPAIRESRAWDTSTAALLVALEREEAAAVAAFDAVKARAQQARRAASALRQLRDMVGVEGSGPEIAAPKQATRGGALNGRWSRKYDACVQCGRSEHKHRANGLCQGCYRS